MMNWKVVGLYLALLFLLVTAGKPLWWLPLGSLVLLVLTFPLKRPAADFDWQLWHPVFATLFASPANATLSRWVRYKKVVGGDSLIPFMAHSGSGILLFDLSKNDLETFLHFVWTKNLIVNAWGQPKPHLLRLLEVIRSCGDRVGLSYLAGFLSPKETEWHSVGCFGIGWFDERANGQPRILPTLGRTFWRVRRSGVHWVFTTDGIAEHIAKVMDDLRTGGSPEDFVQKLSRQDDLTIGWIVPKLKTLSNKLVISDRR